MDCFTVFIGDAGSVSPPNLDTLTFRADVARDLAQAGTLQQAAAHGAIFCEVCS